MQTQMQMIRLRINDDHARTKKKRIQLTAENVHFETNYKTKGIN